MGVETVKDELAKDISPGASRPTESQAQDAMEEDSADTTCNDIWSAFDRKIKTVLHTTSVTAASENTELVRYMEEPPITRKQDPFSGGNNTKLFFPNILHNLQRNFYASLQPVYH